MADAEQIEGAHDSDLARFPDAVQRATVHRRSGIVPNSEYTKVPGLQRTTACCAAPGMRFTSSVRTDCIKRLGDGMRRLFCVFAALGVLVAFGSDRAKADIVVQIDRAQQQMDVIVDGEQRYTWRVSTARPGYVTPPGTYHPQMLAARWFSRVYDNAPMPHSIFFYGGYAIHGTYEISELGRPVSHGCVRLDPGNAAILFDLVAREGSRNTTIVVH